MTSLRGLAAVAACLGLSLPVPAQLVFDNVAVEAGVESFGFGRGAGWSDYDQDGQLDVYVVKGKSPNIMFRQKPDHTFEDVTVAWGLPQDEKQHWTCTVCDYDNDGDDDIFVACGGFFGAETNQMFRNDLGTTGTFTDVSATAGAATLIASQVFGSTALDYDVDGHVDLFLADAKIDTVLGHLHLARNEGGLVFTDVTAAAELAAMTGNFRHCGAGDFDSNGLTDGGVGDFEGDSLLLVNDGDGTFTDVANAVGGGMVHADQAFGFMLADLDLDGWQDIYLPRYLLEVNGPSGLFRNLGGATLVSDSVSSGIGEHQDMGHNVFDLDNDGWFEIFIGTGAPTTAMLDILLRVAPTGPGGALVTTDISLEAGILAYGPTRCHGSAAADYDEDGDIDIYCNNGGMGKIATSQEFSILLRNQGNANDWIEVELTGVLSNRSAIGAQLFATLPDGRTLHLFKAAGSGFGNTDSPIQHFGLGPNGAVDRLDIRWPSGVVQALLAPQTGTRHQVAETGMRLLGEPAIGNVVTLQLCGPPNHVADVLLGTSTGLVAKPKWDGFLQVMPPYVGPTLLPLDGNGRLDLPFVVPDNPALVGATVSLQSWTHAVGATSGPTLTNLVPMTFQ